MNDELAIVDLGHESGAPLAFRLIHVKDLTAAAGIDQQWFECHEYLSRWSMSRSAAKPISKIVVES